jgi:hypothetical protein
MQSTGQPRNNSWLCRWRQSVPAFTSSAQQSAVTTPTPSILLERLYTLGKLCMFLQHSEQTPVRRLHRFNLLAAEQE